MGSQAEMLALVVGQALEVDRRPKKVGQMAYQLALVPCLGFGPEVAFPVEILEADDCSAMRYYWVRVGQISQLAELERHTKLVGVVGFV